MKKEKVIFRVFFLNSFPEVDHKKRLETSFNFDEFNFSLDIIDCLDEFEKENLIGVDIIFMDTKAFLFMPNAAREVIEETNPAPWVVVISDEELLETKLKGLGVKMIITYNSRNSLSKREEDFIMEVIEEYFQSSPEEIILKSGLESSEEYGYQMGKINTFGPSGDHKKVV